jgi:hypothetical protein
MDFLCTNCGKINFSVIESENPHCSKCNTKLHTIEYENIINYASRAVHYGFDYRIEYEKQIVEEGEIKIMYSLLQPLNYLEWLAVSALSGLIGSFVTDLVKYVAIQIKEFLIDKSTKSELSNQEINVINIISDEKQLNQFILYIQNYYQGLQNVDKRVLDAITEEQMADVAASDLADKFSKMLMGNDKQELQKVMLEIAKATNKKNSVKPDIEQTKKLLKELKKELKEQKEQKKKEKRKKK